MPSGTMKQAPGCSFFKNPFEYLGVKLSSWSILSDRHLQVLAAAIWTYVIGFGSFISFGFMVYFMTTRFYLLGTYYLWKIASARTTSGQGNNSWEWFRKCQLWRHLRDYFPVKLVKTVDLDPAKNYLFATFPHGIFSSGTFTCFAADALDFSTLFPGMTCHLVAMDVLFIVPFYREIPKWTGSVSSSSDSISYALDKKNGTGKCVSLIVGGAEESLNSHNGEYKLVLKKRKGFVRIAIKNGSPLVPVIAFGENEIFEQVANPPGSKVRFFQDKLKQICGGVAAPLIKGRGIFQKKFGLIPRRHPITVVVGKPIEVEQNPQPTAEEVDALHAEFIRKLNDLFEDGKSKYLPEYPNIKLEIV